MKPNHYQTLGVSVNASQAEITRAYRRLARRVHPDRQPPEQRAWAEEQMKRLNEAYATLGDPEARAGYDAMSGLRFGASQFKTGSASPSPKERFAGSPPDITSARTRPGKWQGLKTWASVTFWSLVIGFVVIGAYLLLFEWRYMFQSPMQVQTFPSRWALAGVWLILFTLLSLKLIPPRK
jgi:hypothetical protein